MNYLAHGYRFLDSPLIVAGTAVPDWLCVVDRRVRVRSRRLTAELPHLLTDRRMLVVGMLQHLQDDDVFHRCATFLMLEAEIGSRFRRLMPDPYDHRPPLLGHIVTELLLDANLTEQNPQLLSQYYDVLQDVDAMLIQSTVNQVATRPTESLAHFIQQFRNSRFLYDYLEDTQLLGRLNQVLRRVTLSPVDEQCLSVLRDARALLRRYGQTLLQEAESASLQHLIQNQEPRP